MGNVGPGYAWAPALMSSFRAYSGSWDCFRDPVQCQVLGEKFLILGLKSLNSYFTIVIIAYSSSDQSELKGLKSSGVSLRVPKS